MPEQSQDKSELLPVEVYKNLNNTLPEIKEIYKRTSKKFIVKKGFPVFGVSNNSQSKL